MPEHTPGPWHWKRNGLSTALLIGFGEMERHPAQVVATVWSNDPDPQGRPAEEALANARLIGAAPELLAALTRIMAYLSIHDPQFYDSNADSFKARNAIATAKGGLPPLENEEL